MAALRKLRQRKHHGDRKPLWFARETECHSQIVKKDISCFLHPGGIIPGQRHKFDVRHSEAMCLSSYAWATTHNTQQRQEPSCCCEEGKVALPIADQN